MIDDDKYIPGLKKLAESIKRRGARAAIQLQHGGYKSNGRHKSNSARGAFILPQVKAKVLCVRQIWKGGDFGSKYLKDAAVKERD